MAIETVLSLPDLENRIQKLAAHIAAAECEWLDLLAEFDRREAYGFWECASTAHWLNWRCGMNLGTARERVRVARALEGLPQIHRAFSEGKLSFSKVRALTRVADHSNEAYLLGMATAANASQLETIVRSIRKYGPRSIETENVPAETRYVHHVPGGDGTVTITMRLPADEADVVLAAIEKTRDELWRQDPNTKHTRADAAVALAESAIATNLKPGDENHHLVLHADINDLAATSSHATGQTGQGFHVSPETARRLSCDSSVVTQIENSDGEILSVGRKTRTIPANIRRALAHRDKTCRFPGCTATKFVDRHHIKHWSQGGETKISNLVTLCRRHHRLCHGRNIDIQCSNNDFMFVAPNGCVVNDLSRQEGSAAEVFEKPLNVSAETLSWDGDRLNHESLSMIVETTHTLASGQV